MPDPVKLEVDNKKDEATAQLLRNLYVPAALKYLYDAMMNADEDPELRLEAAITLATKAAVISDEEDD